jgi:hypothetical protein
MHLGATQMTASIDESREPVTRSGTSGTRRAGARSADEDAEITDLEKVRADRLSAGRQRRAAARTRDLTALLRDRPDLAGVHAPADFAVDALRWCV